MENKKKDKPNSINQKVDEYRETEGAILLDVRTKLEYRHSHIPGAINIPLSKISNALTLIPNKETSIFVYCLSGHRSENAARYLKKHGYKNAKNIGAYYFYKGNKQRG